MPAAIEVTPHKWTDIQVLFDDGQYSVIIGTFRDTERQDRTVQIHRCIGTRWNGDAGRPNGYPAQGPNPTWYREPPILTMAILRGLLDLAKADPSQHQYLPAIRAAIANFGG